MTKIYKMVCSICKKSGHNKLKCPVAKEELLSGPISGPISVPVTRSMSASTAAASTASTASSSIAAEEEEEEEILSSAYWKNTKTFKNIKDKETQIKYYKKMNASAEVLQLVELDSKPFGSVGETMLSEIFGLGPRTSSQNDGTFNGKKIEIKCARYWAGKDDCVWQHLEPHHDYEYALFALLDFQGWKIWSIKKSLLMGEMCQKKIVTYQGKQGWWTKKSAILPYLTPIKTIAALTAFIK